MRDHDPGFETGSVDAREFDATRAVFAERLKDPGTDDNHGLFDLLERWEDRFRNGDDPTPESLYGADHSLLEELRVLIGRQKRLYARLGLVKTPMVEVGAAPLSPTSIPGYEILAEIGRGGMGLVYRALDLRLGRIVAIKTIAQGEFATMEQRERFRAEAQAVARLHHPNIITIHAIDEHDHRPYLSLEFAAGGSLAQRLAEKPMAPREAADMLETLARAVYAAHQAGVVHRDLKPSNVFLTAEGTPKIADFGLAKLLDSDSGRTLSGQIVGTPSYMAPEQAEGHSKRVGPAADVYALGAILYHALTGRPPFLGESPLETIRMATSTDAVSLRRLRPEVPRDLETICLKCLAKEPTKRYGSTAALADDLRRFLDGRSIAARPVGPVGRLWRWGRRNPMLAATTVALVAGFALGTPAFLVLWLHARSEQARAESQRSLAETARNQMFIAVNAILLTDQSPLQIEELRPYREGLIDKGLGIAQDMLGQLRGDPRGEQLRAEALMARAMLLAEKGDQAQAYNVGLECIALWGAILRRDPANVEKQYALAHLHHQLGVLARDREIARFHARKSNEVYRATLKEDAPAEQPSGWLGEVAMNLHNIGHHLFDEATMPARPVNAELLRQAVDAFDEGRNICEKLIASGSTDDRVILLRAQLERYLSRSHRALAHLLKGPAGSSNPRDVAASFGEKAVSHVDSLAKRKPDHFPFSWELSQTQFELGLYYLDAEQWEGATRCYEAARETLKQMIARYGDVVSRRAMLQGALAEVDSNLTMAHEKADPVRYYGGPRRELEIEAYHICDGLSLVKPLSLNLLKTHASSCLAVIELQEEDGERPDLNLIFKAERLWEEVLRQEPTSYQARAMLALTRRGLADALEARARTDEASRWRAQSLDSAGGDPNLIFALATNYALNAKFFGAWPTKLSAIQLEERGRRYSREAVSMLHQAVASGFNDLERIQGEPLFAPIRLNPDFQAIVLDLQFPANPFGPP
jgi:tetratricopeptide (TPR) repeat protein